MLPLFGVVRPPEVAAAMLEVLEQGQIASGPRVEEFRSRFGHLVGSPNVVTTTDMSTAMTIALRASGVGHGDEVIALPFACMSTNSPIGAYGAQIVWADMDESSASMSPASLRAAITPRTRAVVLYHVAGYPGPAEEIAAICSEAGIALIEDCNNALGASIGGRAVGTFGDIAVYSFYPNRQINTLDGGAVTFRSSDAFERGRRLARYGIDSSRFRDAGGEINPELDVPELGWAASMNNLASAMGLAQLPSLADRQAKTDGNARILADALDGAPGVEIVSPIAEGHPAYWCFLIRSADRDALLADLKAGGVAASKIHHRNDDYTGFSARRSRLPGTDAFMNSVIGLPCGWWLDDADIERVGEVVRSASGVK